MAQEEIARQVQSEKQELAQRAALQKAHYDVMMDQFIQQEAREMDRQTNRQIMFFQKAAAAEKARLEEQAIAVKREYEGRKAEEEMLTRQYEIDRGYYERNEPLSTAAQQVRTTMAAFGMPIPYLQYLQSGGATLMAPLPPSLLHCETFDKVGAMPAPLNEWWTSRGFAAPVMASSSWVNAR